MKAAIYCRLSEEDRNKQFETDDSNSIQNQKTMLVQYTVEQGWELYDIYSDDDYTGSDRKRPEFNRLLADAEKRKFDIILCKTQSRFTRELELVEKYIHGLFPICVIRFISIVDNADTANKGNKKSRQINGLVNEWYLEDMSDNIRSVLTNRRVNGFHIGAFALYGYGAKGASDYRRGGRSGRQRGFYVICARIRQDCNRPNTERQGHPKPNRIQAPAWTSLQAAENKKQYTLAIFRNLRYACQ